LDVHAYDRVVQSQHERMLTRLPALSGQECVVQWQQHMPPVLADWAAAAGTQAQDAAAARTAWQRLHAEQPHVQDGAVDTYELGARVWYALQQRESLRDWQHLFLLGLADMCLTNGYCAQGRTNRYFQVCFLAGLLE